jgi:hypothetical protein
LAPIELFPPGNRVSNKRFQEVKMSPLLVVCLAVGSLLAGLGLYDLQTWLERWDQRRHADD